MMLSRFRPTFVLIALAMASGLGCNNSKFHGGGDGKTKAEPTATPACQNSTEQIGVEVVFVIDNSASNGLTDCGQGNGQDLVTCSGQTHRENAVLNSFDTLATGADAGGLAVSRMAVVSFPSASDIYEGADILTNWVDVTKANRQSVANALLVTRKPRGATPLGAGLEKAAAVMSESVASDRKRIVVIGTDGFPTDESIGRATSSADDLKNRYKADVVTVRIDPSKNDQEAAGLWQKHAEYLSSLNPPRTAANIQDLIGKNVNEGGLIRAISSSVFKVSDAASLAKKFQDLMNKKTVCK